MRRVTAFSALYLLEDYRPLIKPLPPKMFIVNINDIISFLCKFAKGSSCPLVETGVG